MYIKQIKYFFTHIWIVKYQMIFACQINPLVSVTLLHKEEELCLWRLSVQSSAVFTYSTCRMTIFDHTYIFRTNFQGRKIYIFDTKKLRISVKFQYTKFLLHSKDYILWILSINLVNIRVRSFFFFFKFESTSCSSDHINLVN